MAAEQGDAEAHCNLGLMYENGQGIQDCIEAAKWYRKAAEQGLAEAQYNLGFMYQHGQGVPQDFVKAHMWCNLSASTTTGEVREQALKNREILAKEMPP